jgi:hypothetical protein
MKLNRNVNHWKKPVLYVKDQGHWKTFVQSKISICIEGLQYNLAQMFTIVRQSDYAKFRSLQSHIGVKNKKITRDDNISRYISGYCPENISYMHIYNAHISVKSFCDRRILQQCCPSFTIVILLYSLDKRNHSSLHSLALITERIAYTDIWNNIKLTELNFTTKNLLSIGTRNS